MKKTKGISIALIIAATGFILCGTAFAAITGCTVTSHTNVNDPNDTAFTTMMRDCSEITLEDTLRIDHSEGLKIMLDKTFVFSNTNGKHGKIEANGMLVVGAVTVRLTPMEGGKLTGAWPAKESLKDAPYELIKITNTNGYLDPSVFDLFEQYEGDGTWVNFWKSGYKLGKELDSANGKLKGITLTYAEPAPTPISGDVSADVDDGGGGCHIGWSIFGIIGIGLVVSRMKLDEE